MASGSLTVLHVSDLQCGKPFLPDAAEAMLRVSAVVQPNVVVVAGDLTQRAKRLEFHQARMVLDRFGDVPIVITPGNHDVPLYRIWERAASPYANWRRFAGPDLDTVTHVDGATFVALDSTLPHRAIVNGRIGDAQLAFARRSLAAAPEGDLRIVVIHHHLVPTADGKGSKPLPGSARIVRALVTMGVDVVLGGHVHQLHFSTSHDVASADVRDLRPVPLLTCGTTTSRRGRGVEEGWNSLCVLRFERSTLRVEPYRRRPEGGDFEPLASASYELQRVREVATDPAWPGREPPE
jgi:3',5'-cyclic AMP phosphodiesterase CpdA